MMGLLLHHIPHIPGSSPSSQSSSQASLASPRSPAVDDAARQKVDDHKICQWYCCLCGQSYGLITYTGDGGTPEEQTHDTNLHSKYDHHDESNPLHALRYYSQFVYNNPVTGAYSYAASHIRSYLEGTGVSDDDDSNNTDNSLGALRPLVSRQNLLYDAATPDYVISLTADNQTHQVHICLPSRFNCHRCNHMMCPYCPKIRAKDLKHP